MNTSDSNDSGLPTCHAQRVSGTYDSDDEVETSDTWAPSKAKYYDPEAFLSGVTEKHSNNRFSVLHLNADNINTKLESFISFINGQLRNSSFAFDVIAISETHCREVAKTPFSDLDLADALPGYLFVCNSRTDHRKGGVGFLWRRGSQK